jgi:hypothetical protein
MICFVTSQHINIGSLSCLKQQAVIESTSHIVRDLHLSQIAFGLRSEGTVIAGRQERKRSSVCLSPASLADYRRLDALDRGLGVATGNQQWWQPEHDPEKQALGLDPMGGYRFSDKHVVGLEPRDHAPPKSESAMKIQRKAAAL